MAVSAALAAIYLVWQPQTLDLSAQTFRADLWERDGFVIWNPNWYGGHTIPGYSLLYPPLGAWLGPALLGALSAVVATALFAAIALRAWGERAWLGVIWFGLASVAAPLAGRTTFALGLAIGLACVLAVQRRRPALALASGLLTSLASPVAGLFTALACGAVLAARFSPSQWIGRRDGPVAPALAGALGALGALLALGLAFPTDGYQPFALSAWIWIPLTVLAVLVLTGIDQPLLRWGAVLYLVLSVITLAGDSPLGGNVVRLGATFAGPLLAIILLGRRPALLALVAVPLLFWQWTATVRDVAAAEAEPATAPAYFDPLAGAIASQAAPFERVHVSPTRNRWEAVYAAERFPITWGWLRQLESEDLEFLEQDSIEPAEYRRWLATKGASLVAISDAEPDRIARAERRLFDSGAFDDELVAEREPWRIYRLAPPARGVGSSQAVLAELGPDGFSVRMDPGSAVLDLRYTPYLEVTGGDGCVERAGDDRIAVLSRGSGPQTITVAAELSLAAALGRNRHCANR